MSSYMVYTVNTATNVNYFKKKEMSVNRRFSDFLGLHDKLSEKYLPSGRIIPPAPDKSVVGMTKDKMSKESGESVQDEESRTAIASFACSLESNFLRPTSRGRKHFGGNNRFFACTS